MFTPRPSRTLAVKVKGFLNIQPIKYEVRVTDGNWFPYLSPFEPQRFGEWDTDSCWMLSSTNSYAMQLKWLWVNNMFSQEAKTFFLTNNYCDQNGNFSLSERYHEILCGNRDTGGTAEEAWQSFPKRGHIPRSQLFYTVEYSGHFSTQQDFDNDYFNTSYVTPAMLALGQQFLTYVNSSYERIGQEFTTPDNSILVADIKQSPLSIGVSVPTPSSLWNVPIIPYDGSKQMAHEVTMYNLEADGKRDILDQPGTYTTSNGRGKIPGSLYGFS